jgi:Mat/Ecp fimbriae major subunit
MATKFLKSALVLAAGASVFMSGTAHAASATATARANILQQVTVTNTSDLQFGTIVTGTAASTVAISATGGRTCGAGLTCSGTSTAAGFTVTGTSGQVVTVSSDASVTLNNGSGGSMTASLSPSVSSLTLGATGGTFAVGGTLNVGATQADGAYSGTFNVTVDYQ